MRGGMGHCYVSGNPRPRRRTPSPHRGLSCAPGGPWDALGDRAADDCVEGALEATVAAPSFSSLRHEGGFSFAPTQNRGEKQQREKTTGSCGNQ